MEVYCLLPASAPGPSVDRQSALAEIVFRALAVSIVTIATAVLPAAGAFAQARTGAVAGTVRDSTGHAVPSVRLFVKGSEPVAFATSDDSGRFELTGALAGVRTIVARRIGFAPESMRVTIATGRTTAAYFLLRAVAAPIEDYVIEADPLRGKMGPFNKRRSRGVGTFITRAQIEARQAGTVSELLRYVTGVGVEQQMAGVPQPIHMQRTGPQPRQTQCAVQIYVDGNPYPNGNVDDFEPDVLEGIEVYRSAAEIPADFRSRDATCGVIALWTRDPDAARRKP